VAALRTLSVEEPREDLEISFIITIKCYYEKQTSSSQVGGGGW
jgi:hypothetical protein